MPHDKDAPRDDHAEMVVQRRIEWFDTDASGYYHNSVAFRLFESAETMLLERLGMLDDVYGRLPRVHLSADFKRLLSFGDVADVRVRVAGLGNSSITYEFLVTCAGHDCVTGRAVAVYLDSAGGVPVAWPQEYRKMLLSGGARPAQLLTPGDR